MPRKDILSAETMRRRLATSEGRSFWRSLEELADSDEFRQAVDREFPSQSSQLASPANRRDFLRLMGASLALAGLSGCMRPPREQIVPYVQDPEHIVPGKPLYFATAMTLGSGSFGLLVESHMGRPTKVEGNPEHPAVPLTPSSGAGLERAWGEGNPDQPVRSGATNCFAQAAILDMYDPDRSQVVIHNGLISTWELFQQSLAAELRRDNVRLCVLTGTVMSPTLAGQLNELAERYADFQWHQYEPVLEDHPRQAARLATGQDAQCVYDLSRADVILSLDADFLCRGPAGLLQARQFAERRRVAAPGEGAGGNRPAMNRLYVAETTPTITGAAADHLLHVRSATVHALAQAVAARLGLAVDAPDERLLADVPPGWLEAVVDDLQQYRTGDDRTALVLVGDAMPPAVHVLAHAINERLGAVGRAVQFIEPAVARPQPQLESLRALVDAMRGGEVDVLLMIDCNPVFTAPADFEFAAALARVPWRVHMGTERNETAGACQWHLPQSHFLESWSDTRAFDGTASVVQPLIAPLYETRSPHELLSLVATGSPVTGHELVRRHWRARWEDAGQGGDFERFWLTSLHDGVISGTASRPLAGVQIDLAGALQQAGAAPEGEEALGEREFELVFRPDPHLWDGRFANNGWLQELPRPLTKLTWDNAALISHEDAERWALTNGDVLRIEAAGETIEVPVWIAFGHPRRSVTLHFGYGRRLVGRVGRGTGTDVYPLRTSAAPWFGRGRVAPAAGRRKQVLASTQGHFSLDGRTLSRHGTLDEYAEWRESAEPPYGPGFAHPDPHEVVEPEYSLYPEYTYDDYKWGMVIDLGRCVGCNACVIACQAENNIPIVGKTEVARSREMHWLRIDTYFEGDRRQPDRVEVHQQPVPCMHCEQAPCEVVCPVNATVHSREGLNDMVYNRCVGTRYCSNNCPYKVRRFNFFQYADLTTPSLKLGRNPDVTVRTLGVMEKCTYCVQRISHARRAARKQDRRILDGEVATACQAACPTEAIVFGDLNDPQSQVGPLARHPLNYAMLAHLNTKPRTTYLAAVKNPNPRLQGPAERQAGHD